MTSNKSVLPILYSFRRCPYAIRARMAIKESKIEVELREVKLADKPKELIAVSSKGTVPVLVLPDGAVIEESLEIMLWALKQNDPEEWLNVESGLDNHLININDSAFKLALDHYKYADRFPEHSMETYREKVANYLNQLELQLNDHRYLVSAKLSLVDVAVFPFIRQCAFVDKHWFDHAPYPKLQLWLDSMLNSKRFNSVMTKYTQWLSCEDIVVF